MKQFRIWPWLLLSFLYSSSLFSLFQEEKIAEMQKAYHEAEEAMLVRDYALARDRYRHVLQLGRDDEELMSEDLFLDMTLT